MLGVTNSVSAILALLAPPASSAMISRSRADSRPAGLSAAARRAAGTVTGAAGPRIWPGRAQGKGDGIGLAERAAMLVGGIERGLPERVAQPGMVTGAHFRFLRIEGLSGLLVLVVCSAMQGGGDGGLGVRAGGQREAEQRTVHPGHLAGGSRPVQDADEQAARTGGIPVHEVGEPQVHLCGGGQVLIAMGIGDPERVLQVGQGSREAPRPRPGRRPGSPG